ncbi:MAG: hypothetical protein QOD30_1230, partial [Actinomycetota bacterium]|nr:hypothetical protein [Actinomycetota bacterium]
MPELSDLLHGAAPPPAPYDEDDVRRRVHRRRRMRRSLAGVAVVLACVAATGVVLALRDTDDDVAVTSRPTTTSAPATGSARGATTVAIVADEIWIGGDGYVSLGDGSRRLSMPGQVEELATGPDLTLWVRGRNFVAAVDTGAADSHPAGTPPPAGVLGTWSGAATDLVPLPSREVAITSASSDEVVIAKTSAIAELEEVWRIPVRGAPTDIVRTTRGEVWVRCGDGISELDVGAQGVTRTEQWSGRLLAPSLSGGIWTTEGDRLVDLTPANLSQGL